MNLVVQGGVEVVFYEKYSEDVFNNTMIDCIMKSKNTSEEEANNIYKRYISSLTIDNSSCMNYNGSSVRQGTIDILIKKGINFKDFFKQNVENNYNANELSVFISGEDSRFRFRLINLENDIIAWGYEDTAQLAFDNACIIAGKSLK